MGVAKKSIVKPTKADSSTIVETNETETTAEITVEKKVFGNEDLIKCRSIITGKQVIKGAKSGEIYRFTGLNDVIEIEYRDLISAIRARKNYIFEPRIIVEDDDFVQQNPTLKDIYNKMYTVKDIEELLSYDAPTIEDTLNTLPNSTQETVLSIAASMVKDGRLDSVSKIRVLDEHYGVQLMLLTGLYD